MLLLAGCAFMASCADDDYMELDKGDTELALTADAEEITLDEAAHAENALTLTWTSGTNHGTGNRITYKLELAEAGTSFAEPYVLADEMTQQYTWSATTEQLNTLLRDNFGVKADNRYAVEARVTATVAGTGDVQTAVLAMQRGAVDFQLKPPQPEALQASIKKYVAWHERVRAHQLRVAEARAKYSTLTEREKDVLKGVANGLLNKQIADRLGISLPTVKMHRGNVTKKLGVRSAVAIARALERANLLKGGEAR